MLKKRLIMGGVLILVAVALFTLEYYLNQPGLVVGIALVLLIPLASMELSHLLKHKSITACPGVMSVGAIAAAAAMFFFGRADVVGGVLACVFVAAMIWHMRHKTTQGVMGAAAATVLVAVYLGVFGSFYLLICREATCWTALGVVLVTKMGDTGAFFTGSAIGKHKLIPWLSPGKTWEGLAGAVVFCVGFALLFAWIGQTTGAVNFPLGAAAIMGVVLAIVGHAGDLSVSAMKRDAAVKDSGASMPGFGGVLDVLDSPLLAGPAAYWLMQVL